MSSSQVNLGALTPWSTGGDYQGALFAIQAALAKINTATLVQVVAVSTNGALSPIGTVDVQPLINQIDGSTIPNPTPHGVVHGLPYLRLQAAGNGIILDPVGKSDLYDGDIGVAVFCNRDISSAVTTQGQANPGSFRKFSMSDGLYLGAVLSASAPTQYLQFNSDGISAVSPNTVKVTAPSIQLGASGGTPQTLMTDAFLQYWTTKVYPFLVGLGFTGGVAPADSVTTTVEAD